MRVVFTREVLRYAMQTLRGAAASRATLPILENVLLDCRSETVEMSATDLEVGIRTSAYGDVEEHGILTLPARKLAEVTRELPGGDVRLTVIDGTQVLVECADVTYLMFGMPADDFPTIPDVGDNHFTVDAIRFARMIDSVRAAVSTDESRYALNGVYLDITPGQIRAVATDSRRLAVASMDVPGLPSEATSAILPTRAAEGVLRSFTDTKEIRVALTDREMVFSDGEITLSGRLIDGAYPAYEGIIPQQNHIHAVVERQAFLTATKRVSLFSDPSTLCVRLDITERETTLSARAEDLGDAREVIASTCTEPITLGFNAKFLMDAMSSMDSEYVRMELSDPLAATVFRPEEDDDYLHLIMPMRLP